MRTFLLLGLAAACTHPPDPGLPRTPEAQLGSVVMVQGGPCMVWDWEIHGEYFGSGVRLDSRHVLTALHVVDCPLMEAYRLTLPDGSTHPAFLVWEDRDRDQAELETIEDIGGQAPAIGQPPAVGDVVCSATALPAYGVNCGAVSESRPGWFVSAGEAVPGNSGSGVYDSDGRLVGILTQRLPDGRTVVYTISNPP